jgi:hypothetical protein
MHILKNGDAIHQYLQTSPDTELRRIITDRVHTLSEEDDIGEIAHFYVVESAEELKALNLPSMHEVREDHKDWTELVYVISDDGFGLEVFVRKGLI